MNKWNSKPNDLFSLGIYALVEQWRMCAEHGGD